MLRFTSIESLRAWMAWWVVVGHALNLGGGARLEVDNFALDAFLGLLSRNSTAVNVFIVVSGFVITHLMLAKPEPYGTYITRRWFRIFPIFLLCLVFALLVTPLYIAAFTPYDWVHANDTMLLRSQEAGAHPLRHLLLHLTLLHGMVPEEVIPFASSTFLAPAWSLSLEWQFYLLAPPIIGLLVWRWQVGALFAAACLGLSWWLLGQEAWHWKYPSFLPLSMPHFLIGIACRMMITERRLHPGYWIAMALGAACFADWLAVVIWAIFFPIALSEAGLVRLPRLLRLPVHLIAFAPPLVALGKWSYSSYLVHIPLFSLLLGGYAVLNGGITPGVAGWLVTLACLLLIPLSWALYTWVEKPFIRLGSRLAAPRAKPAHST